MGGIEAEPILPGVENVLFHNPSRRPGREIGNIDECRHDRAKRLRKRCHLEPLVQGSALVRLEMTESDPPDRCGVDDPRHGFPYSWKHALHAGMKEQRFLVLDEEMVELKFELGFVDRNAIDVRSDLGDNGHDPLLTGRWISGRRMMRSDGMDYAEGHPTVAIRISTLLRRTRILYRLAGVGSDETLAMLFRPIERLCGIQHHSPSYGNDF